MSVIICTDIVLRSYICMYQQYNALFNNGNKMETDTKVKSLEKSLKILECFTSSTPDLGIAQIAEMLSLSKSNVHNIVSTFEKLGYLEQDNESKKYRLGLKLLEYTFIINNNLSYQKAIYQIISDVANKTSCTTYFAIPKEDKIFYLNNAYPHSEVPKLPYRIIMGETAPYHCTSLGKGMLAYFDDEKLKKVLALPRHKFTPNTIIDENLLKDELIKIRQEGYARNNEEHELGIKCMSVPIIVRETEIIGAISISTAISNFDESRVSEYAKILTLAARELRDLL